MNSNISKYRHYFFITLIFFVIITSNLFSESLYYGEKLNKYSNFNINFVEKNDPSMKKFNFNYIQNINLLNNNEILGDNFFYKPTFINHILGISEPLLINFCIWSFNELVLDSPFSKISPETIYTNVTNPWVWDQDEFYVNHLLHPLQGLFYYTSARSNNLPFWESSLITFLGSVSWELIAENESPSYNDLITTTVGAFSLGEMFHRLYYTANNKILAAVISPMDFINNLILGGKTNIPYGDIYSLDTTFFAGMLNGNIKFKDTNKNENVKFIPILGGASINVVYGDPYNLTTVTPFDHFDFNLKISGGKDYYNLSLFSDGMLASFAPCNNEYIKTTLGLSLHYDFLLSTLTNYSINALGLTAKQNIILPSDWDIKWALHLNWIMLSGSDFYYLFSEFEPCFTLGIPNRIYDLGFGAGIKSSFNISNPKAGKLNIFFNLDWLKTIKNSLPDDGSQGHYWLGISSISYEHILYKALSIGLEYNLYFKDAYYETSESTFEDKHLINMYLNYKFK